MIVIVLLLRLAEALKLFDVLFALTGAGRASPPSPTRYLAFTARPAAEFDIGYASAMAYRPPGRRDDHHHAVLPAR